MRSVRLTTRVAALGAAAALAATMGVTATASASTTHPRATARAQRWSQVTPNGMDTNADIGLAGGAHGVLNVIWSSGENTAGHGAVHDTQIGASGAVGRPATIISGQFTVTDPAAAAVPGHVDAIWNGITNSTGHTQGSFISAQASAGGRWSAPAVIPPLTAAPDTSSSDSAATGADNKPWVAYFGSFALSYVHVGHPVREIATKGCCLYNPGFGVDGRTGATYLSYLSLISHHSGIYVQELAQTGALVGKPVHLPGSATLMNQRVAITADGHGRKGVYVLYGASSPFIRDLDLYRVGSRRPVRLALAPGLTNIAGEAVTPAASGALWAAWFYGDGSTPELFVRLSNKAVSKWGKVARIGLPSGLTNLWKIYISPEGSKLVILALITRHGKTAYWETQVG
jgi:hypothetical protein